MQKINSYITSNINYCLLFWIFSPAKSRNKIKNLQKGALQFLHNDYSISYEGLLEKAGKVKMIVSLLSLLFCTKKLVFRSHIYNIK